MGWVRTGKIRKFAMGSVLALPLMVLGQPLTVLAQPMTAPPADWIPQGMDALGHGAEAHSSFTLDRTTLQAAAILMDNGNAGDAEDLRHTIAKIDGLSVHSFRFAAPGMYDQQALDAVRQQYRSEGWKHLVSTDSHSAPRVASGPGTGTGPVPGKVKKTDVFVRFEGVNVKGMVVLIAGERNINLIVLNGNLSPIDLLHLRGHFGIPKFDGDGFGPE